MATSQKSKLTEHITLVQDLQRQFDLDRGNEAEADDIRDRMDLTWRTLSVDEQMLAEGLAADLDSIGRHARPKTDSPETKNRLMHLAQANEWPDVLQYLREHEVSIPDATIAAFRGLAWSNLGFNAPAITFFTESARLDPTPDHLSLLLVALVRNDLSERALPFAQNIEETSTNPELLLRASEVYMAWAFDLARRQECESKDWHRRSIALAERALTTDTTLNTHSRVSAYLRISLSLEAIRDVAAAIKACESALNLEPKNPDALVMHAWLTEDAETATAEFHRGYLGGLLNRTDRLSNAPPLVYSL